MCGISGYVDFGGRVNPADGVRPIHDALSHRGPNGCGLESVGNVAVAHQRLSIVDLSDAGRQPMHGTGADVCAVVNGEIYNHLELRALLESHGVVFRSRSDSEVVPHLYQRYGLGCVSRLRGMFAVGIHDRREARIVLFRDRFGEKPLYYYQDSSRFLFASELKALLGSLGCAPALDPTGVTLFLNLRYVPSPWTVVRGIRKVEPGGWISVSTADGSLESGRWYDFAEASRHRHDAVDGDVIAATRVGVEEAIATRLMSDVPVGVYLSGGVDSSILAATLHRDVGERLHCFTMDFPDAQRRMSRDAANASEMARAHGMEMHMVEAPAGEAAWATYHRVFAVIDEPDANLSCLATFLLSERAAGQGLRVALTGDGADEAFLGYDRYRKLFLQDLLTNAVRLGAKRGGLAVDYLASRSSLPGKRVLRPDLRDAGDVASSIFETWVRELDGDRPIKRAYGFPFLDLRTWVPDMACMRTDKMAMAHGVELRSPFLDHPLQEYALALPVRRRLLPSRVAIWPRSKYLLKTAFRADIPDSVLSGRKQGFNTPIMPWFRDNLGHFARQYLSHEALSQYPLFDENVLSNVLKNYWHQQAPSYFDANFVQSVLNLLIWAQANGIASC